MPTPLSEQEVSARGIMLRHEKMDNGELRFRLAAPDGTCYIRCENPGGETWENSHSHAALQEWTVVQKGPVIYAEQYGEKTVYRLLDTWDTVITTPGIPHNICMGPDSVILTVKFGDCASPDWVPSELLDRRTKPLTFKQAQKLCDTGI